MPHLLDSIMIGMLHLTTKLRRLLVAGYFHAPGALSCPLGKTAQQHDQASPALEGVCMIFCAVEDFDAMQVKFALAVLASINARALLMS